MDDRFLQKLFRQASPPALERTPSCPDENEIASYVDATIQQAERAKLELHLADCERCSVIVGTLARLRGNAADGVSSEVLDRARRLVLVRPNRWTQYLPHLAAAAVLVLAITVLIDVRHDQPAESESEFRTTRGATATPALQIISPTSGAGVSTDNLVIRWTEIPRVRYYLIRIVTGSGALVTEQRVTGTEWRPSTDVSLAPGKEYYVRVEAYSALGLSTGSIHVPFTVRDTR